MVRAAVKEGTLAGIYLGANQVVGASEYSATGMARKTLAADEFGYDVDNVEYGTLDPGTVTVANVLKDPTDVNGQAALDAAIANKTKFGPDDIKFMRDATRYYTPGTGGYVLITKSGAATVGRNKLEMTSYEFKVTGAALVEKPALVSIAITGTATKAAGQTSQMTATGTYSSGPTADLTAKCIWASDTPAKAVITASGLAVAIATGTSNITATLHGIVGTTVFTVSA